MDTVLPPVAKWESVQQYLDRKKANIEGLGIVRLSKALKWYFFFTCVVLLPLFLYAQHPEIIEFLRTVNAVVVVAIYVVNYGLVGVSYLTSSWPPAKADLSQADQARADGDQVMGYIEKILTGIHITFFLAFFPHVLPHQTPAKHYLYYSIYQIPRIITFIAGFPRNNNIIQAFVFVVRSISLMTEFLAIVYLIFSCFTNNNFEAFVICSVLVGVPWGLFIALFCRGYCFGKIFDKKREKYICFGEMQQRWVIFAVFQICTIQWVSSIVLVYFFVFPSFFYDGQPTLQLFLVVCSAILLAIFTIASLYYSTLKIEKPSHTKSLFRLRNGFLFLGIFDKGYEQISDPVTTNVAAPAKEKGKEKNTAPDLVHDPAFPKDSPRAKCMKGISLVIACHKSENNIGPTLTAALAAGFRRKNIFIAHNGSSSVPEDRTGFVTWNRPSPTFSASVKEEGSPILVDSYQQAPVRRPNFYGVRYCYINIGNKTIALHYVISNYVRTPLVMIIDDDVMIPKSIDIEGACSDLQSDENMKAIAFAIRGIDHANLLQRYQHVEYMQAGFVKIFQADFGSVLCCHGAIALWRSETIKPVLLEHNSEFHGEDLQMGLILRRMNKEYTIGVNAVEPVPTTAPKSLLFERIPDEKSLLVQRVFSWDMASHHFFTDFIEILFLNWERKSLILKPFLLTELWTQAQDWLRIILLISMMMNSNWTQILWALGILLAAQLVLIFIFDRVVLAHRPALQMSRFLLLFYPIYNFITLTFRFGGMLVNVFYYTPWNPPRIKIREKSERGNLPPKVEIDDIADEDKEKYWATIWKTPQEAYELIKREEFQ